MNKNELIERQEALIGELQSRVQNLGTELIDARNALLTEGILYGAAKRRIEYMSQKITSALDCHPNAVKYLLAEALEGHPNTHRCLAEKF